MSRRRCCAKDCFNSQDIIKNVSYFGFPKSEYYAAQWAIAAGREDLTSKSLLSITKYFLCSEHFTDDCFLDPPDNKKLKKTKNPYTAPIPTIFQNNIGKFFPKSLRPIDLDPSRTEQVTSIQSSHAEETTTILVIPESLTQVSPECSYKEEETLSIEPNQSVVEETGYLTELEKASNKQLCRLCADSFNSDELIYIFDNNVIVQKIESLLPGEVKEGDDLSHLVCTICLDKASDCFEILSEFRRAQVIQRNFIIDDEEISSND